MILNYLKIALRNLWKNKGFSAINIIGLSIGLASFILISLYVIDELSYDRYNEKADRIYRINSDIRFGGNNLVLAVTSDPMGPTLKKDYPQVEEFVRFYQRGPILLKKNNQFINEQQVIAADSNLFNVFTLPAVVGDTKTALDNPHSVVISASTAQKYFGTTEAVGKVLQSDENKQYQVTAVIKDIPQNSHFHFDCIFSMKDVQYSFGNFLSNNFQTYILLKKGVHYKDFEKNFKQVLEKYLVPQARQLMNIHSMDDFEKAGNHLNYSLMPLTEIHLKSDRTAELGTNSNIQYVYIFSVVALFILLLACINFMNLSTARSANRAREVGIRKVLGSDKRSLIRQFMVESMVMAFFSLLIAILLVWIALPFFNTISGKSMQIFNLFGWEELILLFLLPVIVGILAGSYPAFYLSSFQPIQVLKGKLTTGFKRSGLRNALVVFQFATSIILIVGTIIVYDQLNYIRTTKLGFQKDQVLVISNTHSLGNQADVFKNELTQLPGVKSASLSSFLPIPSSRSDNTFSRESVLDVNNGINMQTWRVDYDYLRTLGMQLVMGRNFSPQFGTDSTAVLINETTAKLLGYTNPIGHKLYTDYDISDQKNVKEFTIIGVIKNFHYESLRQTIGPLCMVLSKSDDHICLQITAENVQPLLQKIEAKWKAVLPGMPFSYEFMDDAFDHMYRAEQRIGKVAVSFALLAIIIACLGLFGLITYAAEQRTKEMGIRKVLGASISSLVTLLSKDLLIMVLIASFIAFPIAWYAMHQWLLDFAYRIQISWWVFLGAGLAAICIALLTISYQAFRSARANPIKSLRIE